MIREDDEHPGHVDWLHLDRVAAAELWVELRQCAEHPRRRYDLGNQILSFRFKHDPLVEELTAATLAHREVYQQLNKNPYHGGMAAWHYQVLWPLVHRIPTIAGFDDCRSRVCGYGPDEPEIADDSPSSSLPAPTAAPNLNPQKKNWPRR